jgi:hypothetical protein
MAIYYSLVIIYFVSGDYLYVQFKYGLWLLSDQSELEKTISNRNDLQIVKE